MIVPSVRAATPVTISAAGAAGMYGTALPVTARSRPIRAPAQTAAPATIPTTVTNSACQRNAPASCRVVAPIRESSRTWPRRSTVDTTRALIIVTAASAAITPRITMSPKLFWPVFCATSAL